MQMTLGFSIYLRQPNSNYDSYLNGTSLSYMHTPSYPFLWLQYSILVLLRLMFKRFS